MNPGWVYILTNVSLQKNILKIGQTRNEPSERASELSSPTGVATSFEIAYCEPVPDCILAENLVHKKLDKFRVNTRREFFQIELDVARSIVHEICEDVRRDSLFCRKCEAYSAKVELESLKNILQKHKRKLENLKKQVSFFGFCRNYLIRLFSKIRDIFRFIVPERFDRKVYAWGVFIPLCFAAWIIMVGIFPDIAFALTLTVVLISSLLVIGSINQDEFEE